MTATGTGLRRATGGLFLTGAVAFAAAATVLSSTFDWPDILREPGSVVLPAFAAGGTSLVWTWFATAWTYAILTVPILLLPAVLRRRNDPALRAATYLGATSVVLALVGFLRWVFVVPPLAHSYVSGDAATRAATAVPGFPVWDLAGLLGSTSWGLWIAALGVTLLRRPIFEPIPDTTDAPAARTSTPRRPITVGPRS